MKRIVTWLLIACLAPYLTGCQELADHSLTGQLWSSDLATGGKNSPAPYPNLKLSQASDQKDYLVQYDEFRGKDASIRRRAYWLYANQARIEAGKKPHFVNPNTATGLPAILVETNLVAVPGAVSGAPESVQTNIVSMAVTTNGITVRVVLQSDQRHFTVYVNEAEAGTYFLPAYSGSGNMAAVVALTPATAAVDVAAAAAIVAVLAAVIYYVGRGS